MNVTKIKTKFGMSESSYNEDDEVRRHWFIGSIAADDINKIKTKIRVKLDEEVITNYKGYNIRNDDMFSFWQYNDQFGKQNLYSINIFKNIFKSDLQHRLSQICKIWNLQVVDINQKHDNKLSQISIGSIEIYKNRV
jgi:hypothetical protein